MKIYRFLLLLPLGAMFLTVWPKLIRNQIAVAVEQEHNAFVIDEAIDTRITRLTAIHSWRLGQSDAAIEKMQQVRNETPEDTTTQIFLAEWGYQSGDINSAIEEWSTISNGQYLLNKATQLIASEDWNVAATVMELSQAHSNSSFSYQYDAATAYAALAVHHQTVGDSQVALDSCESANDAYELAVKESPRLAHVHIFFASHLRKCGMFERAIAQLKNVDESFSVHQQAWAYFEDGLVLTSMGRPVQAKLSFATSVCLQPDNAMYLQRLQDVATTIPSEQLIQYACSHSSLS